MTDTAGLVGSFPIGPTGRRHEHDDGTRRRTRWTGSPLVIGHPTRVALRVASSPTTSPTSRTKSSSVASLDSHRVHGHRGRTWVRTGPIWALLSALRRERKALMACCAHDPHGQRHRAAAVSNGLVVCGLGSTNPTIASVSLLVNGLPEITTHTETSTTIRETPPWFSVVPGSVVSVEGGDPAGPTDGRAFGYLISN